MTDRPNIILNPVPTIHPTLQSYTHTHNQLRDVAVLLDSQRRSSQLYTALLGAAAAMRDWPTVEQTYREAKQQLAAGFMPARAFRFVEGAYARVQAANNRGGEGRGDLQRPDVPKEDVASVVT